MTPSASNQGAGWCGMAPANPLKSLRAGVAGICGVAPAKSLILLRAGCGCACPLSYGESDAIGASLLEERCAMPMPSIDLREILATKSVELDLKAGAIVHGSLEDPSPASGNSRPLMPPRIENFAVPPQCPTSPAGPVDLSRWARQQQFGFRIPITGGQLWLEYQRNAVASKEPTPARWAG